jgi:putative DNA primase/helicase
MAVLFVDGFRDSLRFDRTRQTWYRFGGNVWRAASIDEIVAEVRLLCRDYAQHRFHEDCRKLGSRSFINNVEKLARTDPRIAVMGDVWDRDPLLVGTPNGTVDLGTGELRVSRSEDMITRSVGATPNLPL